MKLFDKRPLCMILCILLGGFVFFADSSLLVRVISIIIASVAFVCILVFLKNSYRTIAAVSVFSILISALLSFLYFDRYFNVYDIYDGEVEIIATVEDVNNTNYGASTYLKCESIDGKSVNYKLYAYVNKETAYEVVENTRVKFTALLNDFDENGDYLDRSFMRSNGYSAEACDVKNFLEISTVSPSFVDMTDDYRTSICDFIITRSGEDGGGLLCALILGERGYLPFQTQLSFKRCGLSHMLALSGLHLTIITFAISFVLSLFKIRKKPRKIIEIIFVVLYSLLTGLPISVIRAALMHIISSLIFLCAAKSDSITSLSISVALICCCMPYTIYDVSLWLSAFATLGVLVYSELYSAKATNRKESVIKRSLSAMIGGIVVSLFATATTYLIITLSFAEISLIGAIATPLISVFITPFMYLGLVFLIIGSFVPIGFIVNAYGAFICNLTRDFSSIKGIYISAEHIITVCLIIIFTIAIVLFLLLNVKKKKYPLMILLALYILSNVTAIASNAIERTNNDCIYFTDENDEYFLIKSMNTTHFIDVSSGSVSDNYSALEHISSERITEITSYILTSYTSDTVSGVLRLASSIYIESFYLPNPENEDEKSICDSLMEELSESNTNIKTYTTSEVISLGSYEAIFPFRAKFKNKCAFLLIDPSAYVTCYTSSGMLNDDTKNVASEMISSSNRLILGRHGERYDNRYFILKFSNLDCIVVSSKNYSIPKEMQNYYKNASILQSTERINLKR